MCKLLDEVEKKLYIQGLAYVLGMNKQDPKQKKEYLLAQMAETGLSESEYKKIKCNCKTDALIKDLEQITDIRAKRYILREMILLSLQRFELGCGFHFSLGVDQVLEYFFHLRML